MMNFQLKKLILVLLSALLLQACGGGASNEVSNGSRNIGPTVTNLSPATVNEREEVTLSVQATDSDGTIREVRWLQLTGPAVSYANGTDEITFIVPEVTENTDLSFSVDAVDNFGAISSADVEVTILNINRAPTADSDNINVNINDSVLFNLNGSDPDDDTLTYTIIQQPSFGTLTLEDQLTEQYRYTPDADSDAADSIEFSVSDGEFTDTATINFTVISTKQAPLKIIAISAAKTLADPYWIELSNISDTTVQLSNYEVKSDGFDLELQQGREYNAELSSYQLASEQTVRVYFNVMGISYLEQRHSDIAAITAHSQVYPLWHSNSFIELSDSDGQTVDLILFGNRARDSVEGYTFSSSRIQSIPLAREWHLMQMNEVYFWLSEL